MLFRSPAEKLAKVLQIADPAIRRTSFDEVMQSYLTFNSFAEQTREALEATSVPEEWKKQWRERMAKEN